MEMFEEVASIIPRGRSNLALPIRQVDFRKALLTVVFIVAAKRMVRRLMVTV